MRGIDWMKKSSFKLGSLGVAGIVLVSQVSTVAFADEIEKKAFDVDRTRFEKLTAKAKELGIELIIGDIVKDVPTVKDAKEYQAAAQVDLDSQLDKLEKALDKYVTQKETSFDVEAIGTIRVATYVVNPHTVWVTVSGKVLKEKVDGIEVKEDFTGYTYIKREIDDDATIKHIYDNTTKWITESGKELRGVEVGVKEKDSFDGYSFVKTETDEYGNVTHIYKQVESSTTETPTTETPTTETPTTESPTTSVNVEKKAPTTKKLPNTGVGIIGGVASLLGLTGVGAYFTSRKRKK
jgi:LPXTG-motif cell wall-anchored protein